MMSLAIAPLLMIATGLALGVICASCRGLVQRIAALRHELAAASDRVEFRFTVTEIVVSRNDGKVVALRPRGAISRSAQKPSRAAA